jgi:transcriptional antiterminator Rof (Rho-off)
MEDVGRDMRPVLCMAPLDYDVLSIACQDHHPLQQAHSGVHFAACHQSVINLPKEQAMNGNGSNRSVGVKPRYETATQSAPGRCSLSGSPETGARSNVMRIPAAICLGLALLLGGCGDSDDDDDDDRRGGISQQEDDDDD